MRASSDSMHKQADLLSIGAVSILNYKNIYSKIEDNNLIKAQASMSQLVNAEVNSGKV